MRSNSTAIACSCTKKGKHVALFSKTVAAKGPFFALKCIDAIRNAVFEKGNDPHGERDFCTIEVDVEKLFFKIDCYDKLDQNYGSEDPTDATKTLRVGTIMYPSGY